MNSRIFVDGASSGNPGKAGAGYVIEINGKIVKTFSRCIGVKTNNQAEYIALIYALREAIKMNIRETYVFSDSKLLVMQINGKYRVKSENLKNLFRQTLELIHKFKELKVVYIPREKNKIADKLAKEGALACK